MRIDLQVCEGCYTGEHDDETKNAVTYDMVELADVLERHGDVIGIDEVTVTMLGEEDEGGDLPVNVAFMENGQPVVTDTQLTMENDDGQYYAYVNLDDILEVLAQNVQVVSDSVDEEVNVGISPDAGEMLGMENTGGGSGTESQPETQPFETASPSPTPPDDDSEDDSDDVDHISL
ncbi:hypothetical protein ACEU6E_08245 [Halorutilales archaeon Cl-col2-1]